ncbi:MAG: STAS domain-containing protein [Acidimicrobiales bacterium]
MSDELELRVTDFNGTPVLVLQGEIDLATAPRLREELLVLDVSGHSHVIIDLDGVSFLDSTALGVLVNGLRRFRTAGGDLSLVCSQTWLLKLFDVTGLTNLINIHDDRATAVSAMASSPQEPSPNP